MKFFCNKILIFLLFFFIGLNSYALDIVYPTQQNVTINSPSTFFVGNTNPKIPLTINGFRVYVHPTGAFAQKIPLNFGKNQYDITSGNETKTFVIERKAFLNVSYTAPPFKKYDKEKYVFIKCNGTALRSTPVEEGINRLSHLEKDIVLKTDGEQNGLYRVVLAPDTFAWINKNSVYEKEGEVFSANILTRKFEQTEDFYIYKFQLTQKVPYAVIEGNPLVLNIYNLNGVISTFPLKLKTDLYGYDAFYEEDNLVLKVRKEPKISRFRPLKNIRIVVDAGHGGSEKGAVSCLRNNEKDINLKIALYLEKELKRRGAEVYLTRDTDKFMSLNDRVKFSHCKDANIFISIHANSLPDNKDPQQYRGSSLYYYYDEAKPLAENILQSMTEKLKTKNDGLYQRSFAVVRNSRALSVLIETAYVINPYDNELLVDDKFQKNCAKAIAAGVINFYKK